LYLRINVPNISMGFIHERTDWMHGLGLKLREVKIVSLVGDNQIPVGLGMRLALDTEAMTNFANLPESRRKELVNYIQSSTSGEDAKNRVTEVVNSLHNGESFR